MNDIEMMRIALTAASGALETGDVPVGAAIFDKSGELISVAHNERELHNDPTAHAEVVAFDLDGNPFQVTGMCTDITHFKEAEAKSEQIELLFSEINRIKHYNVMIICIVFHMI
jgi:pyrimidine deaminase RibD-like protein